MTVVVAAVAAGVESVCDLVTDYSIIPGRNLCTELFAPKYRRTMAEPSDSQASGLEATSNPAARVEVRHQRKRTCQQTETDGTRGTVFCLERNLTSRIQITSLAFTAWLSC